MTKLTHAHTTQSVNSTVLDSSVVQIESSILLGTATVPGDSALSYLVLLR